jgi:subtilisin
MAKYVMINRRAGKFTEEAKLASRASIASAMSLVSSKDILEDRSPKDKLARRVVVLDLDEAGATRLASQISSDVALEPLVRRQLHYHRPAEVRDATPLAPRIAAAVNAAGQYQVSITAGGASLGNIDVMFYVADQSGHINTTTVHAPANGRAGISLTAGQRVVFVEPIPYAGSWIMLAEAPPSGSTVDCTPIVAAPANRQGWWHAVTKTGGANQGQGINVGVIDTGCGPHPNLRHVTLVGVFTGGQSLPAAGATDVAEHGTHTTGIIGARPTRNGDYIGMAPACNLFHARVFASEEEGPSQADLINAIDTLSRDHQCDLINMSLGGGGPSPAEEDSIRDALERGTLCICSAGNDSGPVNFPGAYPECVSVSAIGQVGWAPAGTFSAGNRPREPGKMGRDNLFLASFSSNGTGLDATGPGVGIVSTVPDRDGRTDLYMEMDGTSMASPAVCATLAAILSADGEYSTLPRDESRSKAARQLLESNCVSIGLGRTLQGLGLPEVGASNGSVSGQVATRATRKRKARA